MGLPPLSFFERLKNYQSHSGSLLCVGIDPDPQYLEGSSSSHFVSFCQEIVRQTAPFVCAFKLQSSCFSSCGFESELSQIIDFIHDYCPGVCVILDAKRGDVPVSSRHYARECFERYGADATTVQPYLGVDSISPFLSYEGGKRGVFVLCRTSNGGGSDLQELLLKDGFPVYHKVSSFVSEHCSSYKNCGLVMGATALEAIARVRRAYPDLWFLLPGIGPQGGSLEGVLDATGGEHILISVSRSICYPLVFPSERGTTSASVAKSFRDSINQWKETGKK